MSGGGGNDIYIVDNAGDTVIEVAGGGSSIGYTLGAEVEKLFLTGSASTDGAGNSLANLISGNGGNNTLSGGDGNDTAYGGEGNDTLTGGSDFDVLDGGEGNDRLTGGDGADLFIYAAGDNGIDIITDFSGQTDFAGGTGEADTFTFENVLQGSFDYRGDDDFTGTGNTEARVSGGQVLIDTDGNHGKRVDQREPIGRRGFPVSLGGIAA